MASVSTIGRKSAREESTRYYFSRDTYMQCTYRNGTELGSRWPQIWITTKSERDKKGDDTKWDGTIKENIAEYCPYSDFQGQLSEQIENRCATLLLDCAFNTFHGRMSVKNKAELGYELHDTKRNDPRRVGRSNGMRHLLGNCKMAFQVVGLARSSRSHEAWTACVVVRKVTRNCFDSLVWFIPATRRICFAERSQCYAKRPRHTRWRFRPYWVRCSLSPFWSMHGCCVPAVYQVLTAKNVVIWHDPESKTHWASCNPCQGLFNHFTVSTGGKCLPERNIWKNISSSESRWNIVSTQQPASEMILISSD